jgi:16S rRNA (guanine(966)-N(2))-methyltransferase RsmD
MRISGGDARGIKLKVAKGSRPTAERVRQAVMSSLGSHLLDARVLDLFCGSGAYGLEALSRGASSAVFVDDDATAIAACRENARAAGVADRTKMHKAPAERYLDRSAAGEGPFDLVFVDPPYTRGGPDPRLLGLLAGVVTPAGRLVWESRKSSSTTDLSPGWVLHDDRRYGDTRVLMFRRGQQG